MKSTKNILMTGVALAIALFASVQVTAMHLTSNQKKQLEHLISTESKNIEALDKLIMSAIQSDNLPLAHKFEQDANKTEKRMESYRNLLRSTKPYTHEEFSLELRTIEYIR